MGVHGLRKAIAIGVLVVFVWMGVAWAVKQGIADAQKAFEGFRLVKPAAGADTNYSFSLSLTKESNAVTPRQVIGAIQLRSGEFLALVDGRLMEFDSTGPYSGNFNYNGLTVTREMREKGVADAITSLMAEAFNVQLARRTEDGKLAPVQSYTLFDRRGVAVGYCLQKGDDQLYCVNGKWFVPGVKGILFDVEKGRAAEGLKEGSLAFALARFLESTAADIRMGKNSGAAKEAEKLLSDMKGVLASFQQSNAGKGMIEKLESEIMNLEVVSKVLSQPGARIADYSFELDDAGNIAANFAVVDSQGRGGVLKLTVPAEAASAASSSAEEAERKTKTDRQSAGQPGNRVVQTGGTGGVPQGSQGAVPAERKSKLAFLDQKEVQKKPGEAGAGESVTFGSGAQPQPLPAQEFKGKDIADEYIAANQKRLVKDRAGSFEFSYIVLSDEEIRQMSPSLARELNFKSVFIRNENGYFVAGQEKVVRKADKIESIFAVSKYYAYYLDGKGNLWIYSQKKGMFSDEFSTFAKITFTDINGVRMTGLALIAFAKFAQSEGLGRDQIADEMEFMEKNFGIAWTDENGAIIDDIFNRSQFRLGDGRVGVFTVTGQIDPKTNKGYNWATVRGGNTYAGLGGDMVDIKSLLTRAEYRDLALAILSNKSLMVEMIVRVTGSYYFQHNELNGVAEDIKKFLDYDTSQAPNGYDFDIVNGQVVVTPIGGQRRSQTRPKNRSSGNAEPFFAFYNLSVAKQIQLLPNTKIFLADNQPYCKLAAIQGQGDDENEEVLMHIRQLGVPDQAKREKDIYWLVISGKRAMSKLYEALGDPNPLVRLGVLEVFSDMREEEVKPTLLKAFQKEKDPKVKIAYSKCLTKLGIQELAVVEAFIRNLKKEKNENVLAEIITALRLTAGEKKSRFTPPPQDNSEKLRTLAGKALLEKLRDPNTTEFVKLYLVKALGELKEIRALSDLADLVDPMESGTGPLQLVAMQALKMIGSQEAVHILINCFDHPRREISEAAGPLLASLNTVSLDALISKLLDTSKNRVVRAGCADAIGEMNDFGKSPFEKDQNIEKAHKALEAAKTGTDTEKADPYVGDKATKALERLKKNGFKRDSEHLIF